MIDVRINRRQLLKGAGLGASLSVASAVLPSVAVSASNADAVSGTIEWLDEKEARLGLRTTLGVTTIQLTEETVVWRDERTTLARFEVGDEVSAEGDGSGDSFAATTLLATMHSLVATVESRRGNALYTDAGVVYLNEHSRPQGGPGVEAKPLYKIGSGDRLVARGRRDRTSGALIAFRAGVESSN